MSGDDCDDSDWMLYEKINELEVEIAELRDENARLRAVLKTIMAMSNESDFSHAHFEQVAFSALKEGKP